MEKNPIEHGTHLTVLKAVVDCTTGPVLEMGCGFGSTPHLHKWCESTKRQLVSLENNQEWLNKLKHFETDWHQLLFVKDWALCKLIDSIYWDVVLVDHAPGERRKFDINRLQNQAKFVVVHDTEQAPGSDYQYEPTFQLFKHRFDDKRTQVWTTVVSNKYNLGFLK